MFPILSLLPALQSSPAPVVSPNALFTTRVGGLERTQSTARTVAASGHGFRQALRVEVGATAPESNATQLTLMNEAPVDSGDLLLASFWVRGQRSDGSPARGELMFEKSTSPWTKSVTEGFSGGDWHRVAVPFASAASYRPGEAMLSLRFAFGKQWLEIGGLSLVNYRKSTNLDALRERMLVESPIGTLSVDLSKRVLKQTMVGLGGNFCQPRYGSSEPLDLVGRYTLEKLKVRHARIGLPLNSWVPQPGVYQESGPALASLQALGIFAKRKIPLVVSIWEGPQWLLPGQVEASGRILSPDKYDTAISAIIRYLTVARDKHGAKVDFISFNEPDYGVNFKFTPATMADFIRTIGPRLRAAGLPTKFLVGDTANGTNFADYARPLLQDASLKPYLGPLAFHSWDALTATDEAYTSIAELGRKYGKPVWCLEAGHDAQLWQANDPWASWENALRTALAYERTLRLSEATIMDYWTYQDNYPLVDGKTSKPYAVFEVMQRLEQVFAPGTRVATVKAPAPLAVLASQGRGSQTSVLIVNPSGPGRVVLRGLTKGQRYGVTTNARSTRNLSKPMTVSSDGSLTIDLPLRSVVTVSPASSRT